MADEEEPHVHLTKTELEELVKQSVQATLFNLGIRTDTPGEIEEFRRDVTWVREFRRSSEALKRHGMLAAVTVFMTGFLAALWVGFKDFFR